MAADVHQRVNELENEMKVLKNEIKAVLLDIREQYLNAENPFTVGGPAATGGGGPMINISSTPTSGSEPRIIHVETRGGNEEVGPTIHHPSSSETTSATDTSSLHGTVSSPGLGPSTEDEVLPMVEGRGRKDAGAILPSLELREIEEDRSLPSAMNRGRKETPRKRIKQTPEYRSSSENGAGISLITVAGLSRWVDDSVEKIGKERTEVMVEACHVVGYLPEELKDLLNRLVRLAQVDEPKKRKIATGDYLSVIAQLDSLLGFSSESEGALLSILTSGREVVPSNG